VERVVPGVWSVPVPIPEHGDLVDVPGLRLRAIWTPGHSPGHLCFHDETHGLLLTGDHVLPRITPNVSAYDPESEPPAAYLDSLEQLRETAAEEVLPAQSVEPALPLQAPGRARRGRRPPAAPADAAGRDLRRGQRSGSLGAGGPARLSAHFKESSIRSDEISNRNHSPVRIRSNIRSPNNAHSYRTCIRLPDHCPES
jgi:glyoxylase-like metal-dependent hydrolase (beta-lactamase superfamily II)